MHYGGHCAPIPMQMFIYLFIGGSCAVLNISLFLIFRIFFSSLTLCVFLAFAISALANYLMCIALLFRHKARWSSFGEVLFYLLTLLIMGSTDYFVTFWFLNLGMTNLWAKSLSIVVGFFGNFLLRKYLIFQERNKI